MQLLGGHPYLVRRALYLVASRSLAVSRTESTRVAEGLMNILNAGEPLGDMALLTSDPRTATSELRRTARSCVSIARFRGLVREQPASTFSGTNGSRPLGAACPQPNRANLQAVVE